MRDLLKTERLVLRRPILSDAARMSELMNDPEIVRMTITVPYPFLPLAAEFWIMSQRANWNRGLSHAYAITNEDGGIMGISDIFTNSEGDKEIGYWIGRPYWGEGYMTEAAQAIIDEGFASFDVPYIDAGYFYDNPASGRILEKLGFIRKEMGSNFYSIARGERAAGIELRLPRPATINGGEDKGQSTARKVAQ